MTTELDPYSPRALVEGIALDFHKTYSLAELELIRAGFSALGMDDKWHIYYQRPYLHFHRSGSDWEVYRVRLEESSEGAVVTEALMAPLPTNPEYDESVGQEEDDLAYEARFLEYLIAEYLLDSNPDFPE